MIDQLSYSQEEPVEGLLISLHSSISQTKTPQKVHSAIQTFGIPQTGPFLDSQTLSHAQTSPDLLVLMFEYSFGLQTQEVVELLTFKPFELQLLFEFVDEEQYQTHSISSSILFLNHSEEIVKLCGDDSTTISFIAQILTLSITNSSDIVAEYSSAGQITFSESMLELDKTNEPEQAPNVHGFASFSGLLFENRWEDFIRVNEAILAVVERVQRRTRLDGSELAFPPLIQTDLLSEVTSTLLKVVEKKTEEHTHKLVSTAIQSSLTLDSIPEKYESLFVLSVPLLQRSISFLLHLWTVFASLVEGEPTTVSSFVSLLRFVSLLQNWQLTLTGIKSFVHIFYSLLHTKDPRLSLLFQLAAHCHPSLPLLPFSTLLQWRLANKVCGAGEVDLCVLTLSSLLTNTHVAVTQFNQESGEGSWCVVDQKATRDKEERKCV
ncbi:hypothetical protein BLNAU_24901 [Blattamonas nauphoetae]|uniref:Uncharacterized protein n=1 Tax=Blattamonas nauphoetae TaxID=2049346 RepID=A0ABQ9WLK6_9EUKA|nr:hypothetical protein BLNAU_24913 [Blattamonas nauphoetae]KAK2940188.1 hypothetical protein BLNAU_24901 [Blattamonas nauphoetae]